MISSKASEKQLRAITHPGGLLVSAGAGAGKTFVIVERVVHELLEIKTQLQLTETNYNEKTKKLIENEVLKICVITFTVKSAQEMRERIYKRIKELSSKDYYFACVERFIHVMNISTIHSLCYQVIKNIQRNEGLGDYELVDISEKKSLLKKFMIDQMEKYNKIDQFVIASHFDIFVDQILTLKEFNKYEDIQYNLSEIFSISPSLPLIDESWLDKKWALFLEKFYNEFNLDLLCPLSEEIFFRLYDFFLSIDFKMPQLRPSPSQEIKDIYQNLRLMMKFFKENQESFLEVDNREVFNLKDFLLNTKDEFYKSGFFHMRGTFDDLEQVTLNHLKEREQSLFNLLIVDEVQDISLTQYQIFQRLVCGNLKKLFMVGDVKQAIYGFRGGDIDVFSQLKNDLDYLFLDHNFRSSEKVILFNNTLFDFVFNKGFNETIKRTIDYEYQIPGRTDIDDTINPITILNFENASQFLRDGQCDSKSKLEAYMILQYIKQNQNEEICLLVRNNRQSDNICHLMSKHQISYKRVSQLKISKNIYYKFGYELLVYVLNQKKERLNHFIQSCECLLSYIFKDNNEKTEYVLEIENLKKIHNFSWWVYHSAFVLGYSDTEEFEDFNEFLNINYIDALDDRDKIFHIEALKDFSIKKETVSLGQASNITIMTSHSSKGLEFDHIILCGLYDREVNNSQLSLLDSCGRPHYQILKNGKKQYTVNGLLSKSLEVMSVKNESKRLFYVACTRARKKIVFANLDDIEGNAWSRLAMDFINAKNFTYYDFMTFNGNDFEVNELAQSLNDKSPYKRSKAVIGSCLYTNHPKSITSGDIKIDCQRHFLLKQLIQVERSIQLNRSGDEAKEGSIVHHILYRYIMTGEDRALESQDLSWAKDRIDQLENEKFMLLPEYKLSSKRFKGRVDLIAYNRELKILKVIDYKTGRIDSDKMKAFSLQLNLYAELIDELKLLDYKTLQLQVWSLSGKKVIEIERKQYPQRPYKYDNYNLSSCIECDYITICHSVCLLDEKSIHLKRNNHHNA